MLFAGNDDRHLYAVNTNTGQVRWTKSTHGDVRSPIGIGSNGRIYFGDVDGFLNAVGPR